MPTRSRLTTFPSVMRQTVPSPEFETHTDPKPQAASYGAAPTCNGLAAFPVRVSIRVSVSSAFETAQTAPRPTARLKILGPTPARPSSFPRLGSMRITSPAESPPTQMLPPAAARPYDHCP